MRCERRSRLTAGFTIVELLIVIAVIGLLATLTIPAVLAVQERARSTTCQGHLRNLGSRILSFHGIHDRFPSAVTTRVQGPLIGSPTVRFHNFAVDLLAFDDSPSVHDRYNFEEDFCSDANALLALAAQSGTRCPSAPSVRQPVPESFDPAALLQAFVGDHPVASQVAKSLARSYSCKEISGWATDYTIIIGVTSDVADALGYPRRRTGDGGTALYSLDGMFPLPSSESSRFERDLVRLAFSSEPYVFERALRLNDIRDGAQRTIMLAEDAGRPASWQSGKEQRGVDPNPGSVWSHPQNVVAVGGSARRRLIQDSNRQSIYSFHPGHCNMLFADGHGESISIAIAPKALVALVTPMEGDASE